MSSILKSSGDATRQTRFPLLYTSLGSLAAGVVVAIVLGFFREFAPTDMRVICRLLIWLIFCTVSAYIIVRDNPRLIFSPMPWFLLASGVYFGFGPMLYYFGNEMAIAYSQQIWYVGAREVERVTIVNTVGITIVFLVWLKMTAKATVPRPRPVDPNGLRSAIIAFYAIGLPPRCLNIMAEAGLVSFTVPGVLLWIANLTGAGLIMLTIMSLRKGGGWWVLWGGLLALDLLGALLVVSKMAILLAIMPCVFGYLLYKPKKSVLWLIPVFLAVVYLLANSFVTFAREKMLANSSMANRMGMAQAYLESEEEVLLADEGQLWWVRLNYANAQEFAMQEYESGSPGNSLKLALIAPIPRILWPDKPIIESGRDFYERLTGQNTATFGIGFFSEAYWNGGWLAVILCSAAIGWLFAVITMVLGTELSLGNVWALPFALLWIRSGARVDGWIHTEIVGPAVFTLIGILAMRYWLGPPKERMQRFRNQRSLIKPVRANS